MLSSDINPSDPALSDITDANDIPSNVQIDDYGYGSDSDLDDDDEDEDDDGELVPIPVADREPPQNQSAIVSASPLQISVTSQSKDIDE